MGKETMFHNSSLTSKAQALRKNMTKEERRLWYEYLRTYPCRFRRQVAFGKYILDFYCAAAKLIVELDGSQHYEEEAREKDQQRTAYLEQCGLYVFRVANNQIKESFDAVCEAIDLIVKVRTGQETL